MINKKSEKNRKYYSVLKIAKMLHVSRITVFNRIKKGQIPAIRIGRSYLIPAKKVSALLGRKLSEKVKEVVDAGVHRAVSEYAETLRLLGKE